MGHLSPDTATIAENMNQSQIVAEIMALLLEDTLSCTIREVLKGTIPPKGWSYETGQLQLNRRLYVLFNEPLHLQIIHNHHDHPISGHFGQWKTTNLIFCIFHWPGLGNMVKKYIRSCTTCARAKASCHKPYRLLKKLPIPIVLGTRSPWISLSNSHLLMVSPPSLW